MCTWWVKSCKSYAGLNVQGECAKSGGCMSACMHAGHKLVLLYTRVLLFPTTACCHCELFALLEINDFTLNSHNWKKSLEFEFLKWKIGLWVTPILMLPWWKKVSSAVVEVFLCAFLSKFQRKGQQWTTQEWSFVWSCHSMSFDDFSTVREGWVYTPAVISLVPRKFMDKCGSRNLVNFVNTTPRECGEMPRPKKKRLSDDTDSWQRKLSRSKYGNDDTKTTKYCSFTEIKINKEETVYVLAKQTRTKWGEIPSQSVHTKRDLRCEFASRCIAPSHFNVCGHTSANSHLYCGAQKRDAISHRARCGQGFKMAKLFLSKK